jgi:NADPH:quinone reductase
LRTRQVGDVCSARRQRTQLIALDTTLSWEVLGALPETSLTAAGPLQRLSLEEGETLLLRGGTSWVGLACLELARAAGVRVATTRSAAKGRRLTELGAAGIVLDGDGFAAAPNRHQT